MENLNDRQNELLSMLRDNKFMTIADLSRQLYASEATIRRDLQRLSKMHLIHLSHGGVSLNSTAGDYPLALFNQSNLEQKRIIGMKASQYVHDNDVLFLDATSTVSHLLNHLHGVKNLTIFTNGLETAQIASRFAWETYLVGGKVRGISACCYGPFADSFLREVYFDSMFFSVPAISASGELTHYSPDLIPLIRNVMQRARQRYLLCVSEKYNLTKAYHVCDASELTAIISDAQLPLAQCT